MSTTATQSTASAPASSGVTAFPAANPKEMQRVFDVQKRHFHQVLKVSKPKDRVKLLKRLLSAVERLTPEIKAAIQKDFRKAPHETDLTEIMPSVGELKDAIRHVKTWMKPERVKTPVSLFGATSTVVYEPKGVTLIIAPWNYPFYLAIAPLAAALAAGNTAIIKPSEFTPETSKLLARLVKETFQEGEVAVFEGDHTVSTALMELPFDHIFFTGSTHVGKIVMAAAAKNLSTVTLELGGKSPAIVVPGANLKRAAKKLVWGKIMNAGQTCVAPDYLLLPEGQTEEFVKHAKEAVKSYYGHSAADVKNNKDFCRLVNQRNFQRVSGYIHEAVEKGGKIVMGGETDSSENYIEPTLLANVPENARIMEDEIFGPVMPIITYKTLDEAVEKVLSRPKPLALYVFGSDSKAINKVLRETSSGGAAVNEVIIHLANPNLPFGGINHSGHGSYHGWWGFKTFSHEKSVFKQAPFSSIEMLYPPYTGFVDRMIQLTKKFFV
ncbi:aldehyde dehydrogenase family protein [Leptospira langatensis]|uniref:Aldehyde dehydrogenase n=1 Tax=Leptospira langatensis TaxID=2484983 RepID=A0A5F1ZS56_9LEPT|nr:aldehyde dehydrogenase family protein [Leptospira langatensis]TGJ98812.1 aldehyde dehydrogenase family protein [Leptospira langatensis]TGL40621.1 aldehyde dehydrogenase family protein [Leptospira langatensis]